MLHSSISSPYEFYAKVKFSEYADPVLLLTSTICVDRYPAHQASAHVSEDTIYIHAFGMDVKFLVSGLTFNAICVINICKLLCFQIYIMTERLYLVRTKKAVF